MTTKNSLPAEMHSSSASERRAAVRALTNLTHSQMVELRALRASEQDVWVRKGMDGHLASVSTQTVDAEPDVLISPVTAGEIREQARTEIADIVVHELRHAALRVELAAELEISEFKTSQTKSALDGFRRIASSLRELAASGKGARMSEVAIADVVQAANAEFSQSLWPPEVVGESQIVAQADPGLLQLAVSNAIRNAIEATQAALHAASPVFVTWGRTDRDAWIAVHDDGVGLESEAEVLFEAHRTTKGGSMHAGLGLAIARNSMRAMGGDVLLENRDPRGALCELRWPLELAR